MTHTPASGNLGEARAFYYESDLSGQRAKLFTGNEVNIDGQGVPAPAANQPGTRYTYDKAGRLTKEEKPDGTTTDWEYDRVGNRRKQTVTGGSGVAQVEYVYDANDRLLHETTKTGADLNSLSTTGVKTSSWNDNGQLVETTNVEGGVALTHQYAYNFNGTLRIVREVPTSVMTPYKAVAFDYDADGNRLGYQLGTRTPGMNGWINDGWASVAEVRRFAVDTQQAYAEVAGEWKESGSNWNLQAHHALGLDRLAAVRPGQGPGGADGQAWYVYDGLGSTRALTSGSGALTDGYRYEAFGKPTRVAGVGIAGNNVATNNPFLFNGQQYDGGVPGGSGANGMTGLADYLPGSDPMYYLRARYYQPGNGRFISQDPFAGREYQPNTLHRYLYVENNPVTKIDPSGRETLIGMMMSLGINVNLQTKEGQRAAVGKKAADRFIREELFDVYLCVGADFGFDKEFDPNDRAGLLKAGFHAMIYVGPIGEDTNPGLGEGLGGVRYDISIPGGNRDVVKAGQGQIVKGALGGNRTNLKKLRSGTDPLDKIKFACRKVASLSGLEYTAWLGEAYLLELQTEMEADYAGKAMEQWLEWMLPLDVLPKPIEYLIKQYPAGDYLEEAYSCLSWSLKAALAAQTTAKAIK